MIGPWWANSTVQCVFVSLNAVDKMLNTHILSIHQDIVRLGRMKEQHVKVCIIWRSLQQKEGHGIAAYGEGDM